MDFENDSNYLDQHFLVDDNIINKFIDEANLTKDDTVVEIGPGKGVITELIAPKIKKLICIELDKRLEPFLRNMSNKYKNIELIFGNTLDVYIPDCNKIVTSLPYSIIEPFIDKLLKCRFNEIIMITGNRYATSVETNEITKLSLLTNCFFKMDKIIEIIPDAFMPKPRVMSALIRLTPIRESDLKEDLLLLFRFMFYYRDKKLKNCLIESLIRVNKSKDKVLTQKEAKAIIDEINLSQDLLDKCFNTYSNIELKLLYNKLESISLLKK